MDKKTDKEIFRLFVKVKNLHIGEKIMKPIPRTFIFLISIICMMTDRMTVKINYILDVQKK